jgi:hypothetical protein
MLMRTDLPDRRDFGRHTFLTFLDSLKNRDFLAVCLFTALGLVLTICLARIYPVNDTINLIGQFD